MVLVQQFNCLYIISCSVIGILTSGPIYAYLLKVSQIEGRVLPGLHFLYHLTTLTPCASGSDQDSLGRSLRHLFLADQLGAIEASSTTPSSRLALTRLLREYNIVRPFLRNTRYGASWSRAQIRTSLSISRAFAKVRRVVDLFISVEPCLRIRHDTRLAIKVKGKPASPERHCYRRPHPPVSLLQGSLSMLRELQLELQQWIAGANKCPNAMISCATSYVLQRIE